ncbi:MAG: ABC transporter ATP-binding protein [Nitrosopumilus sp. D6]|nr:MAG: ABC transporter ATP-binding protein [Nitrosopumilus sp. D6]
MAILTVSGVKKSFGGNTVLDGVDMEIEGGTLCQLIGSNGSGKTTLINAISGMFPPDAGTITFENKDITRMGLYGTYNAGLVRTWQIPQPFENLTALENFMVAAAGNSGESFLLAPGRGWRDDEKRILDVALRTMEDVNLHERADTLGKNLSGGQKKLLELGRAMMSGAKMILMDEPIAGVNPTLAHEIFERIADICKIQKITFFIVEHRLDISLQYVSRVFAMDGGRIIAQGSPDEVTGHPLVVESYLGK